jgi:hypothetical protein
MHNKTCIIITNDLQFNNLECKTMYSMNKIIKKKS